MARRKVQLAWIMNASARKSTFKKRRDCLLRKVMEISTLTGEDACGIVLSPDEGDPPIFWPSSINRVLERYFGLPEADQIKKMITLDSFMHEKICKMEEQLEKGQRKARNEVINYLMHSIYSRGKPIGSLNLGELHVLFLFLAELEGKCESKLHLLNQQKDEDSLLLPTFPILSLPSTTTSDMFINNFYGQPMLGLNDPTDGEMLNEGNNMFGINQVNNNPNVLHITSFGDGDSINVASSSTVP